MFILLSYLLYKFIKIERASKLQMRLKPSQKYRIYAQVRVHISRSSPRPPEMESEIEFAFTFWESSHRENRFLSLRAALKSIIPNMGNLVPAINAFCLLPGPLPSASGACGQTMGLRHPERHRQLFSLT